MSQLMNPQFGICISLSQTAPSGPGRGACRVEGKGAAASFDHQGLNCGRARDLRRSQGFVKEVTQRRLSPVGLIENEFRRREPQGFFREVD